MLSSGRLFGGPAGLRSSAGGDGEPNQIARMLNGDGTGESSAGEQAASRTGSKPSLPPYLKKKFEEGRAFNTVSWQR